MIKAIFPERAIVILLFLVFGCSSSSVTVDDYDQVAETTDGYNPLSYWNQRYKEGGNSGRGSRGMEARYKINFLNSFIKAENIKSVTDIGVGDAWIASRIQVDNYIGYDISPTIIKKAREQYPDLQLRILDSTIEKAELLISLDVLQHLNTRGLFEAHIQQLFSAAEKFVIIYSTNFDKKVAFHVYHHEWLSMRIAGWKLIYVETYTSQKGPNKFFGVYRRD